MLADKGLRNAISMMRREFGILDGEWPYVERITELDSAPTWAIDDEVKRYVVLRTIVFDLDDLKIAAAPLRKAAMAAFARLDAGVSA